MSAEIKEFNIDQLELLRQELPEDGQVEYEYEGVFTKEVIHEFTQKIMKLTNGDFQAQKKFFYVFIELAQNVSRYSDWRSMTDGKNSLGIGAVIFGQTKDSYYFLIGNVVENSALKVLIRKCEIINSLDRESLRLFKRQQRNLIVGTNQGAHIGLIMVVLTTRKKLDIRIKPIDEMHSFFILRVFIEKKK